MGNGYDDDTLENKVYRLPTEAEWEYACRGGSPSSTAYSFGDNSSSLSDYAWWGGISGDGNAKSEQYPHEVGRKPPNGYGLFDMHGNVWELCSDVALAGYPAGSVIDPVASSGDSEHARRGGAWDSVAGDCRSANRFYPAPVLGAYNLGFRVAVSP